MTFCYSCGTFTSSPGSLCDKCQEAQDERNLKFSELTALERLHKMFPRDEPVGSHRPGAGENSGDVAKATI